MQTATTFSPFSPPFHLVSLSSRLDSCLPAMLHSTTRPWSFSAGLRKIQTETTSARSP